VKSAPTNDTNVMMSAMSVDAAPNVTVTWGGLADTIRNDCTDTLQLDGKPADLLRRLDEFAACRSMAEIGAFLKSDRCFSDSERDYLMSPLLDDICLCCMRSLMPKPSRHGVHRDMVPSVRTISIELAVTFACMNGLHTALHFFVERGGDIRVCPFDVFQSMCFRLTDDDLARKRKLKLQLSDDWDPFLLACASGHASCAEYLLRQGYDVNARGRAALGLALRYGHESVIELLLKENVPLDLHAEATWHNAVFGGVTSVVKRCVAAGPPFAPNTAILQATTRDHVDLLSYLLDLEADNLWCEKSFDTAVGIGSARCAMMLLQRGVDPAVLLPRFKVDAAASSWRYATVEDLFAVTFGGCIPYPPADAAVSTPLPNLTSILTGAVSRAVSFARFAALKSVITATDNRPNLRDDIVAMLFCAIATQQAPYPDDFDRQSLALLDWLTTRGSIDPALIASGRLYYGAAHYDPITVFSVLEEFNLPLGRLEQALRVAVNAWDEDIVIALLMRIRRHGDLEVEVLRSRISHCFCFPVMQSLQKFEVLLKFTPIDAAVDLFCARLRHASLLVLRVALSRFAGSENRLIPTATLTEWLSTIAISLKASPTSQQRRAVLLETMSLYLSHGASEDVVPQDLLADIRLEDQARAGSQATRHCTGRQVAMIHPNDRRDQSPLKQSGSACEFKANSAGTAPIREASSNMVLRSSDIGSRSARLNRQSSSVEDMEAIAVASSTVPASSSKRKASGVSADGTSTRSRSQSQHSSSAAGNAVKRQK